jgi:hypothetical protein
MLGGCTAGGGSLTQTKDYAQHPSQAVDQPSLPTLLGGSHDSTPARASKVRERAMSPCIFREMTGEVCGARMLTPARARHTVGLYWQADATDLRRSQPSFTAARTALVVTNCCR